VAVHALGAGRVRTTSAQPRTGLPAGFRRGCWCLGTPEPARV